MRWVISNALYTSYLPHRKRNRNRIRCITTIRSSRQHQLVGCPTGCCPTNWLSQQHKYLIYFFSSSFLFSNRTPKLRKVITFALFTHSWRRFMARSISSTQSTNANANVDCCQTPNSQNRPKKNLFFSHFSWTIRCRFRLRAQ